MALSTAKHFFTKYPLARGMLAYSITWPTGNLIQQTIDGKKWDTYNWNKCLQFALYGSLYVAPSLFGWIKLSSKIWPVSNFRTAIMKTVTEQLSYGPLATASFFFILSLMDHKTVEESKQEVCEKFWPTYKIGVFYWTTVQTLNYTLVPERNRVPIVSLFGLIWTTFLAYMKQTSPPHEHNKVQHIVDADQHKHSAALRE
ncbi:mpv17-like protein [Contarinia nasturtii]|uniref:mpv17-like protein n=1 Tax=Contarinia nasturtii TaxID=265458 RepID=UPI0012D3F3C2|nr:mpv17-like protein [Contarinia nasturtii]XP_031635634.1 mpv17-like protein [Contarinia nasturtii]XP_031635635.1 mpv17-like protein [Contarinia nasturtii]XP_031635636.1 mpv17-like protein [Contarinia nasturtii]